MVLIPIQGVMISFPPNALQIPERGEVANIFDPSSKKYSDYGIGLGSVNIGYGSREIADAAYAEIIKGNRLTRASIT